MAGPYWDQAFNPIRGCTPISPGCQNCWARSMHERFRKEPFTDVVCLPEALSKPLHWRKPRVVFIDCADLFHEKVPDTFIEAVFGVMHQCPQLTFLICTKRAERMRQWVTSHTMESCLAEWTVRAHYLPQRTEDRALKNLPAGWEWPPPNVWLGVTAENQAMADERIPLLLATPAAHRWVSIEPALSMVQHAGLADVDQIVWGAESGRGMRMASKLWARDLLDDMNDTATSVFIKQIHDDNDRLVTDPALFPPDLRVRDLAWRLP
ncbi:MAG: DUF5131 family protein [Brevundimonas sp.]